MVWVVAGESEVGVSSVGSGRGERGGDEWCG